MHETPPDLIERDVQRERSRYQWAAAVLFGAPFLLATIAVAAATLMEMVRFSSDDQVLLLIVIGNGALSAIGSGFGVWLEPGDRQHSKIFGMIGGGIYGLILYTIFAAVGAFLLKILFFT